MSKKHKICVVGAGKWGRNHIRTLSELNCLGGIVEKDGSVREKMKSDYPNCLIFSDLNESFKFNFDGYVVSTPPLTHYEIAKKIILKGNHILVEKPLTMNLQDAIDLNDLAKNQKVNLMVGHVLLFHPAFNKVKELIDDEILGEIQYIYSNRLNLGKFRNDENVLWSFAPHDIALFNYFFDDVPFEVTSNGIDILQEGIHDTSITTFKYTGKRMRHIFVSWLHPFKEHRFVLIGSKGMLHFEDSTQNSPLIYYDKTVDLGGNIPRSKLGETRKIDYDDELPLTAELNYFISHLDKGKIEIANGDSAVDVMVQLARAAESLKIEK